jgi:hypothetical protein
LYWTGRSDANQYTFTVAKGGITKNYDKRRVSIKGPNATSYAIIPQAILTLNIHNAMPLLLLTVYMWVIKKLQIM